MKRLLLAICGLVVMCACGGGGGGGGGGASRSSRSLRFHFSFGSDQYRSGTNREIHRDRGKRLERQGSDLERFRDGSYGHGLRDLHQHHDERGNVQCPILGFGQPQHHGYGDFRRRSHQDQFSGGHGFSAAEHYHHDAYQCHTECELQRDSPSHGRCGDAHLELGQRHFADRLVAAAVPGPSPEIPPFPGLRPSRCKSPIRPAAPGGPASAQAQLSLTVVTAVSISTTSLAGRVRGHHLPCRN